MQLASATVAASRRGRAVGIARGFKFAGRAAQSLRPPLRVRVARFRPRPYVAACPMGQRAPVAQLDRAPDYESGGRTFESFRARHFFQQLKLFGILSNSLGWRRRFLSCAVGIQRIPLGPDGSDDSRALVIFQRDAEPADVDIDRSELDFLAVRPHRFEQLLP